MLGEGISSASIEQASLQAGYPASTLALLDEFTLLLPHSIFGQLRDAAREGGSPFVEHPGDAVLGNDARRSTTAGPSRGAGFYECEDGRRTALLLGLEQ